MTSRDSKQNFRMNEEELAEHISQQYLDSIKSLAIALEARDSYTHGHSLRVTQYSLTMAKQLKLPEKTVKKLQLAGILHDIGKIGVKEEVLHKPDKLTKNQYEQIKTHPLLAVKILRPLISDEETIEIIKHHHESWNGKGYPDGLKGEDISLCARIIVVCDTFDAITSNRPYRKAQSISAAFKELLRGSGSQFDPFLIRTFCQIPKVKLEKIRKLGYSSLLKNFSIKKDKLLDI